VTDLLRWGSAGFPNKQFPWSGAGCAVRQHGSSILLGTAAALGLSASVFLGIGYVRYERLALSQEAAVRRAESANADLQDAMGRMRDQLGAANQSLGLAQSRMAELRDDARQAATTKIDRIGQLSSTLDQAQRALHLAEAQRVTLMARLSKAENDIAEGQSRAQQAQTGVSEWQKKVQQLSAERERALAERDQLRSRITQLEQRLALLQTRQPARPVAETPAPTAAAPAEAAAVAAAEPAQTAAAPARVAGVLVPAQPGAPATQPAIQPAMAATAPAPARPAVAVGRHGLAQFERVLASAGVDVPHLFAQYGMRTGEGGPFLPAPRGAAAPESSLTPEKLVALSRIVKALPVTAPLQS